MIDQIDQQEAAQPLQKPESSRFTRLRRMINLRSNPIPREQDIARLAVVRKEIVQSPAQTQQEIVKVLDISSPESDTPNPNRVVHQVEEEAFRIANAKQNTERLFTTVNECVDEYKEPLMGAVYRLIHKGEAKGIFNRNKWVEFENQEDDSKRLVRINYKQNKNSISVNSFSVRMQKGIGFNKLAINVQGEFNKDNLEKLSMEWKGFEFSGYGNNILQVDFIQQNLELIQFLEYVRKLGDGYLGSGISSAQNDSRKVEFDFSKEIPSIKFSITGDFPKKFIYDNNQDSYLRTLPSYINEQYKIPSAMAIQGLKGIFAILPTEDVEVAKVD